MGYRQGIHGTNGIKISGWIVVNVLIKEIIDEK